MNAKNIERQPLQEKAIAGVIEELQRQAAENPSKLKVQHKDDKVVLDGEVDVDSLVMVVIGSVAGGP